MLAGYWLSDWLSLRANRRYLSSLQIDRTTSIFVKVPPAAPPRLHPASSPSLGEGGRSLAFARSPLPAVPPPPGVCIEPLNPLILDLGPRP